MSTLLSKELKLSNSNNFLLQFLPICLVNISKSDIFYFNGKKLKSSYAIDIVHSLILKFYFKKENKFNLSSLILKDKYGYLYNYYINFLIEQNILILEKNYFKGKNAKVYSLNSDILVSDVYRFKNFDKVLLRKSKTKNDQIFDSKDTLIKSEVKKLLISDLYSVKIEHDRSIFFLNSLKDNNIDLYQRNKYSIESIDSGHIFYHFDSYGRMHTNFTILKSFIRKNCLLIDGERTCEIDIKNSQPLFLSSLIEKTDTKWVKQDEFDLFKKLVINGTYYQYLMDKLQLSNRKESKSITYKVFFGRNNSNSKPDLLFHKVFPTIHNFIKLYKKEFNDYKILAYDLQRAESNLIFNNIILKIKYSYPGIKIITIHDSLIVKDEYKDIVNSIFDSEMKKYFNI